MHHSRVVLRFLVMRQAALLSMLVFLILIVFTFRRGLSIVAVFNDSQDLDKLENLKRLEINGKIYPMKKS